MTSPISSSLVSPQANASEISRQELQARLNGLGGINGRKLDPEAKAKKLREACEGFESIFIQKMWQEMRNTVPKGGLLHGREEKFWQDMYDQELSKSMTKAGGIGLADMMYEQLSRNLVSASRGTASMAGAGSFMPQAAPFLPGAETPAAEMDLGETVPAATNAVKVEAPQQTMASVYDGQAPQTGAVPEGGEVSEPVAPVAVAANNAPQQPVLAPVEPAVTRVTVTRSEHGDRKSRSTTRKVQKPDNGIELAYLARREAGDKLGSRAIRPALHKAPRHERDASQPVETPQPVAAPAPAAPMPGSADALSQAVQMARSGALPENAPATGSLNDLVAQTRARNASRASAQAISPAAAQAGLEAQALAAQAENMAVEGTTRRVRYSTNNPTKNTKSKKNNQAIRMLNVDNPAGNIPRDLLTGQPAQNAAPVSAPAPLTAPQAQQAAVISPLTAQAAGSNSPENQANFSIPPLKAPDLQG